MADDALANGKARVFIGVELTRELSRSVHSAALALSMPGVSIVQEENLHITLAFLGDTSAQVRERITSLLSDLEITPFLITVRGFGTFDAKNPRVVYAGIGEGSRELIEIYDSMLPVLKDIGMHVEERAYSPHITVARLHRRLGKSSAERLFAAIASVHELGSMRMPGVSLIRSELNQNGATYTRLFLKAPSP
ncbi:MAG: RNA 2',3'-cyclic phosphodiesterase [Candidatus Marsarchaeota archaeon]|jgi:2'-5' RNA ligase|nr:RNA 2',3'-cyclic phosphodiesterase [Candidatus Marsarchaeota archaeon]